MDLYQRDSQKSLFIRWPVCSMGELSRFLGPVVWSIPIGIIRRIRPCFKVNKFVYFFHVMIVMSVFHVPASRWFFTSRNCYFDGYKWSHFCAANWSLLGNIMCFNRCFWPMLTMTLETAFSMASLFMLLGHWYISLL